MRSTRDCSGTIVGQVAGGGDVGSGSHDVDGATVVGVTGALAVAVGGADGDGEFGGGGGAVFGGGLTNSS